MPGRGVAERAPRPAARSRGAIHCDTCERSRRVLAIRARGAKVRTATGPHSGETACTFEKLVVLVRSRCASGAAACGSSSKAASGTTHDPRRARPEPTGSTGAAGTTAAPTTAKLSGDSSSNFCELVRALRGEAQVKRRSRPHTAGRARRSSTGTSLPELQQAEDDRAERDQARLRDVRHRLQQDPDARSQVPTTTSRSSRSDRRPRPRHAGGEGRDRRTSRRTSTQVCGSTSRTTPPRDGRRRRTALPV